MIFERNTADEYGAFKDKTKAPFSGELRSRSDVGDYTSCVIGFEPIAGGTA
jgi:hypothetical protein